LIQLQLLLRRLLRLLLDEKNGQWTCLGSCDLWVKKLQWKNETLKMEEEHL
jgi:hypothetical protein